VPRVHRARPVNDSGLRECDHDGLERRVPALRLGVGELLGSHDGSHQCREREVGDSEPVADQVAARLDLLREAATGRAQLLEGVRGGEVVDAHVPTNALAHAREGRARHEAPRATEVRHEGVQHQVRLREQMVDRQQARVRADVLVEEVLEVARAPPLLRVGRVEGRAWLELLERLDDVGRVSDRPTAQHEDGERRSAAQTPGELAVSAGGHRAAHVGHALVVQGPARLLVVVRDLEVPEDRGGVRRAVVAPRHRLSNRPLLKRSGKRSRSGVPPVAATWSRAR